MTNNLLQIKIKQRLNKLDSFDYDNFQCWMIQEAVNKSQIEWTRRMLYSMNSRREGAEQSSGLIDDLQRILKYERLILVDKGIYWETTIPDDYLHYVRTDAFAIKDCCPERRIITYEVEEANISIILDNDDKQPDFEWGETVVTRVNNRLRVYTNKEFAISQCYLYYFRKPVEIQFKDCINPNTGSINPVDVECEFNDDVAEIIADGAAAILAGDIEAISQYQRESQSVQTNS